MNTDQAIGHNNRNKYHICAIPNDWHFFFINSNPAQKFINNHIEIDKSDWPQMVHQKSYVLISNIFSYTEDEVYGGNPTQFGCVTMDCMRRIVDAALGSKVLEQWKKDKLLEHLSSFVS